MTRWVDLTLPLSGDRLTPVPGLPGFTAEPVHTHAQHGRSNTRITLATHLGTHVDAPYHFVPEGLTIDTVPLERLAGRGVLADLRRYAQPGQPLTLEAVRYALREAWLWDAIVLLWTGWAQREMGSPTYYERHPFLAPESAQWLRDEGVKAVGVDFPVDPPGSGFPVHHILLGAGIPLVENLVNLEALVGKAFEVLAFPVKIGGGDGGPARVVARLL
ncbi:Kynurenine formamidase [bacterium HR23]|nr:Kynurenine formamidase [bacterium HR23]